jgi:uncharacterized protein (UPF0261 family)
MSEVSMSTVYVIGTCDTKEAELSYAKTLIEAQGVAAVLVDVGTKSPGRAPDVTAAEMLRQLDEELNADGVHLAFAEMRSRLQELTQRYGLLETIDGEHFYPTLEAALAGVRSHGAGPRPDDPTS